jgi:hypothetical protein
MMMTDKRGIIRLTRVAQVRALRLARAAEDAKLAHEACVRVKNAAEAAVIRQEQLLVDARDMFARDPACPQAKLWLAHSVAQMGIRADAVIEAESNAETAEAVRAEAVRSVARHKARIDRIDEHYKKLLRADGLRAETRAELDVPAMTRVAIL